VDAKECQTSIRLIFAKRQHLNTMMHRHDKAFFDRDIFP